MAVSKWAWRNSGPVTGIIATPSRTDTLCVSPMGFPISLAIASGVLLLSCAIIIIVFSISGVIAQIVLFISFIFFLSKNKNLYFLLVKVKDNQITFTFYLD